MQELRTALLVLVPEADSAVGELRSRLDPAASVGVPAHVTALFPFLSRGEVVDDVVDRLRALFASIEPFAFTLARTGWFGDEVLHLVPEPDTAFRSLTRAVFSAFPSHPPYGGQYGEDADPHLTIANGVGSPADRRAAETDVGPHLPVAVTARAVTLFGEQASGRWEPMVTFPFARSGAESDG